MAYFLHLVFCFPGMLIVGCLLRNVPKINIAKDIESDWSRALRCVIFDTYLHRIFQCKKTSQYHAYHFLSSHSGFSLDWKPAYLKHKCFMQILNLDATHTICFIVLTFLSSQAWFTKTWKIKLPYSTEYTRRRKHLNIPSGACIQL